MKTTLFLVPAYGRSYNSVEELIDDWESGKDFRVLRGPYTSIRDFDALVTDFDRITAFFSPVSRERFVTLYESDPKNLIDRII